ncbi:MAG: GIY-YIG nuclease family protein [Candidatus Nanoarchaeia archaeon]|nr:GIY-YIG nuclease family protein [Candidatus Nanoarchaeia archaeon]
MKGIYILIINIDIDTKIRIGSLGTLIFKKGKYAYVGSAQNNLTKRINRHLSKEKKRHWHIDYLLDNHNAKIEKIYYKKACKEEECKSAEFLMKSNHPIIGFGCSDCKCKGHLFEITSNYT